MKFDKEHWKEIDINIDSLWIIGPRAKGGKRENNYHGNFVPQIPDHLIRRYTEEGDIVLEPFTGSGTTLYECERLKRNYIGFDINHEIINYVNSKMKDCEDILFDIYECDSTKQTETEHCIKSSLKRMNKQRVDFVLAHPPYWDILKFTDLPEDLSNISDYQQFIHKFTQSMQNAIKYLRAGKHFAIVVGDLYRDSEVVPLGFHLMDAIKSNIKCKLKGIVIKDMVGNRAKQGIEALWRYRTLKSDNFLFKHEYIFVFKKG
jgi:DNA modification methylase